MHPLPVDSHTSHYELHAHEQSGTGGGCSRVYHRLFVSSTFDRTDDFDEGSFGSIGRRVPLAVLILISGLSAVSLAIALLGAG